MSPSFTHRQSRVHRYYVSNPPQRGEPVDPDGIRRVPAQALEELLIEHLQAFYRSPGLTWAVAKPRLRRAKIHPSTIQLLLVPDTRAGELEAEIEVVRSRLEVGQRIDADTAEPTLMRLVLPIRMQLRGGRTQLTAPPGSVPIAKPRIDESLVRALKSAHRLMAQHELRPTASDLRVAKAPDTQYKRHLCGLAFLAPDIQRAILEGRQPAELSVSTLMAADMPLAWVEQRRSCGFA